MTGSQGGVGRRRPSVYLDHVLVPCVDLDEAARRFEREYGLVAVTGGRHPGAGTANRVVPLGTTYIELIAVVDEREALALPRSRRVLAAARAGLPFTTWAARTDDLDAMRAALLAEGRRPPPILPGARRRPDGVLLEWRTQELVPDAEPSVLPFLIEWRVPPELHPAGAAVRHHSGAGDIVFARFTAPDPAPARAELRALIGDHLAFEVAEGERPELVMVQLESPGGRIRIP